MKETVVNDESRNNVYTKIAMALLIALVCCIPVFMIIKVFNVGFSISDAIHTFNCYVCVITLVVQALYWYPSLKNTIVNRKKINFKEKLSKNWPIILLAVFMAWTAVGCMQAGMEMNAEIQIKNAKSIEDVPQRIIDIANWSSGDRMSNKSSIWQNAADRAWFGCENLRDGYFSFLYYAAVMLSVLMLGVNAEDKKKWIVRALLITSFIISFVDILCFLRPYALNGIIDANRFTFNNSNHFAYYYTVVAVMSVVMFIKEDNIYFKGLSLLNIINYFFIMIMNNTFGAQIGIGFAMLFLLVTVFIRLIARHKVKEFVLYMVTLLLFLYACGSLSHFSYKKYSKNDEVFSITSFRFRAFGSTYKFYTNSITQEEAEDLSINKVTIDKKPVEWGTSITDISRNASGDIIPFKSSVTYNIENLVKDAKTILGFYTNGSEEVKHESGETTISANSGNVEQSGSGSSETSSKELTDEVAFTGSGRGRVWIRSLDLMNQRPMFGWGLENLLNEFYQQYNIGEGRTHNLLLQLGACTGIPGVLIYYIATIAIFLKVMFDAKLRKYKKPALIFIGIVFVTLTIALNFIIGKFTDKLLFNGIFSVVLWAILFMAIFIKKLKFRLKDWNYFEMLGSAVFVSYMIGSFFGNSAFYTSPYFMIFLGILVCEMLHKTSRFDDELVAEEGPIETKKEEKVEKIAEEKVEDQPIKQNNTNNTKSSKNTKKKKRR